MLEDVPLSIWLMATGIFVLIAIGIWYINRLFRQVREEFHLTGFEIPLKAITLIFSREENAEEIARHEAPKASPTSSRGIPPSQAAQFVEREGIMDDLRAALLGGKQAAIVGVGGMGGVGKTEVAIQLANEIEASAHGSVVWVTVADRPLGEVHNSLGRAVGLRFDPTNTPKSRHEALLGTYRGSGKVVFLDDVRAGFTDQLELCLLPCAMLLTSRQHNLPGLPAGAMHDLDVMTKMEALELLRGVRGLKTILAAEPDATEDLVKLCSKHPLALDLAARRLLIQRRGKTPVAKLNTTLGDRLGTLKTGRGPLQSLTANFDLSYAELNDEEQERYRKLAVFAPTGFSTDAAAAVWGLEVGEAQDDLEQFEDASLVLQAEIEGRWRPHDLLGEYAAEKLAESGESKQAYLSHANFLLDLFQNHFVPKIDDYPLVMPELDNLLRLAEWAQAQKEGTLLGRLATIPENWLFVHFKQVWEEWEGWLTGALELEIKDKLIEANTRRAIGDVQRFRDQYDAALESYRQALDLYQAVGDRLGEANSLKAIGDVQRFRDQYDAALESYRQALDLYQAVGARLGEANTRAATSRLTLQQGDLQAAEKEITKVVKFRRAIGDVYSEGSDYYNFSLALMNMQEREKAKEYALMAKDLWATLNEAHLMQRVNELIAENEGDE